jgi:hypothetical protein
VHSLSRGAERDEPDGLDGLGRVSERWTPAPPRLVLELLGLVAALGLVREGHRVDHQRVLFGVERHELEQVPGAVWSGQEVARRVTVESQPSDRVVIGMCNVLVGHAVSASTQEA